MEKRESVPESVWQSHLDWFNVTGETTHRHLRELHRGQLGARYQSHETEAGPTEEGDQSSVEGR